MEEKLFIKKCMNDFSIKLRLRDYALSTSNSYLNDFSKFINNFKLKIDDLTYNEICEYVLNECKDKSHSFQNGLINAIKFYYEKVRYRKRKFYKIDRPKQFSKLPQVIDHDEIMLSISKIDNIKHKAIISLAYSCGLRVSEVVNLKIEDIDSKRMILKINCSKGKKDRIVPLSQSILFLLREYYKQYRPLIYLFESYKAGDKYSICSCQQIWKKYKINQKSTFHTLRHSCFTYLLENGVDIRIIKDIAGHNDIKTTEGYCHVSKKLLNQVKLPI
jgi:site-specific recombinase XerD